MVATIKTILRRMADSHDDRPTAPIYSPSPKIPSPIPLSHQDGRPPAAAAAVVDPSSLSPRSPPSQAPLHPPTNVVPSHPHNAHVTIGLADKMAAFLERWVARCSGTHGVPDYGKGPTGRMLDCAERLVKMDGVFEKRPLSAELVVVTLVHIAIAVAAIVYPFVTSSRLYDGLFLVAAFAAVVHWLLLNGECVLNYVEKKLRYVEYHMGQAPFHHWWASNVPMWCNLTVGISFLLGWTLAVVLVVMRNVTKVEHGIGLQLQFGRPDAAVIFNATYAAKCISLTARLSELGDGSNGQS